MTRNPSNFRIGWPPSLALVTLVALGTVLLGAVPARGAEIIPSVGMTRPVEGSDRAQLSGGLALRAPLLSPQIQSELAIGYHSESRFDDQLRLRVWPVTASLLVFPIPNLYGQAGVGFYNTTLDYNQAVLGPTFKDETRQDFGVHVGGGVRVPMSPNAALDLNGRYVMMRQQEDRLVPDHFNPDFWTTNLGLALHF